MSVEAPEKLSPHQRLAKLYGEQGESVTYYPSNSEELLEDICRSFGTTLNEAFIDHGSRHLTRLSKPVVLTSPRTGQRKLFQAQYTRFSPFSRDSAKMAEVYKKNHRVVGKKSDEKILEEMWQELKEKDNLSLQVTDAGFNFSVPLARWRKGFYFALFNLFEGEQIENPEPFYVFESGQYGLGASQGRRPDLHITFYREPKFIIGQMVESEEDIEDRLYFEWPRTFDEHGLAIRNAGLLHPVTYKNSDSARPSTNLWCIPASEPVSRVMGFIQAYIRNLTTGARL